MTDDPTHEDAAINVAGTGKTLLEQMEKLGVEEFHVEVVPDADAGEDAVRVISITPKPKK